MDEPALLACDWGTTNLRAWTLDRDGAVVAQRDFPLGVSKLAPGEAERRFKTKVRPALAAERLPAILCGMIGSNIGWQVVPYADCPAGLSDLAKNLTNVADDVRIVPGLRCEGLAGSPDVMRGEETQVLGVAPLLRDGGIACLPGTHSKWVRVSGGRIVGFTTHMTGEAFAALRGHTILGRMMRDGPADGAPFEAGLARSAEPGGLLHHLFGVRALGLANRLEEADAPAYLSGILIGHEVRAALARTSNLSAHATTGTVVQVIGTPELTALYARAIAACGGYAERHDGEAAARGLALIAEHAQWS
jgi:2-dehydro-3-deoxygalactonokinase